MSGKVSMVIPCYNKVEYIDKMLNSIFNQLWDNLEVILVNDGSTDGTDQVIYEWQPKLLSRGYEVKIIDQENGGCCSAVYTGLKAMTGDYFCLVDCDDEIYPEYVSKMANWLDEHYDYEWCACNADCVRMVDDGIEFASVFQKKYPPGCDNFSMRYIFRETITTAWIYMSRVSYLHKCGMIDMFCVERRRTYEPLIVLPQAMGGGKLKYFDEPLYKYNTYAVGLFNFDRFDKAIAYYEDYLYLYRWVIERLSISNATKQLYLEAVNLNYYYELIYVAVSGHFCFSYIEDTICKLVEYVKTVNWLWLENISSEAVLWQGWREFFAYLEERFIDCISARGKIICYGVKGKVGQRMLPKLLSSCDSLLLELMNLWDLSATDQDEIMGRTITKPCFSNLSYNDTILIFPKSEEVVHYVNEISSLLPEFNRPKIYCHNETIDYINNYINEKRSQKERALMEISYTPIFDNTIICKMNEERYSDISKKMLYEKLDSYQTVCFDFFDVLVMRPFYWQGDMFNVCAKRLGSSLFQLVRNKAESELRNKEQKIISIYEIYDFIKTSYPYLTAEQVDVWLNMELLVEKESIVRRTPIIEALTYAKQLGKQIFITSDSYYTKSVLYNLLDTIGVKTDGIEILSACEYRNDVGNALTTDLRKMADNKSILYVVSQNSPDYVDYTNGDDVFKVQSASAMIWNSSARRILLKRDDYRTRMKIGEILVENFSDPFLFEINGGIITEEVYDE